MDFVFSKIICPSGQNNHVWFPCNGWFDISCVAAPGNDFATLKYSLRVWLKLRLGTFQAIESTIATVFFFIFYGRRNIIFFIQMMMTTFNYLLFSFLFDIFMTNSSWITFINSFT